jgi:hypothetical protein
VLREQESKALASSICSRAASLYTWLEIKKSKKWKGGRTRDPSGRKESREAEASTEAAYGVSKRRIIFRLVAWKKDIRST